MPGSWGLTIPTLGMSSCQGLHLMTMAKVDSKKRVNEGYFGHRIILTVANAVGMDTIRLIQRQK